MKRGRLDQILLRVGTGSEEQIQKALLRQKSRGGKLGTHLLFYRYVSEEQLVNALAEQFQVGGVRLGDLEIPDDVVRRIPASVAEEHGALPFRFDRENGELHVAIADPENPNALGAIRGASGNLRVVFHVGAESVIRDKIAFHHHGRRQEPSLRRIIDLPDLFEEEKGHSSDAAGEPSRQEPVAQSQENVLLYTRQVFLRNVLPSIFEREGLQLSVATSPHQAAEFLKAAHYKRVLVSEDAREEFERIASENESQPSFPEVTFFRAVGDSLLENPVSYGRMFDSLLGAVRFIADQRASALPYSPPYALISQEILGIGREVGLDRIVIDGLRIAAHLLVPPDEPPAASPDPGRPPRSENMFGRLDVSIHIAKQIDYPWDIASCLNDLMKFSGSGRSGLQPVENRIRPSVETGVLSLVWYRHHVLRSAQTGGRGDLEFQKSGLRYQAGRLAPSSVVEAYVRVLESSDFPVIGSKDIVIVGEARSPASRIGSELKAHGFLVVEADTLQEARKVCARRKPAAILIHVDESLSAADQFCRHIREDLADPTTALFAVTQRSEPSFLLNLMDTWFSDVLPLPMNGRVAVARIAKALSAGEKAAGVAGGQGFGATFKDLSFMDLVQTLGSGLKDVRMRVDHSSGVQAEIFFRRGRIVYAECGRVKGVDAVYHVIRWQDDGSFRIEPANAFPADNVAVSNDYMLLEGARLLDESRTGT